MSMSRGAAEAWLEMDNTTEGRSRKVQLLRSMNEAERWETLGLIVEALAEDEIEEVAEEIFSLAA